MSQNGQQKPLRRAQLDSVQLAYMDQGGGDPILCIHGSWDDHHSWDAVADTLSRDFRVVSYDRRGHSASTTPPGQGHLSEDVADALALMNILDLHPAHIIGHSYGANVAIALAGELPSATLSLFVHEPPLFALLTGDPELEQLRTKAAGLMQQTAALIKAGEIETAAKLFVKQVAFGEQSWEKLFNQGDRRVILANVDTWLDQFRDPQRLAIDVTHLQDYPYPMTLSTGSCTLPAYRAVTGLISQILPSAAIASIEGAGHGAHISHPERVAEAIYDHINDAKTQE